MMSVGRSGAFVATPYTHNCATIAARGDHAVVGISPFNSYYKPARIETLVEWACHSFARVDVMTSGFEAAYPLAMVMSPRAAARRVRRAIRQVRRPAVRALTRCGVPEPEDHVACWTRLLDRPAYAALVGRARVVWDRDAALREVCEIAARMVLAELGAPATQETLRRATAYAVAELPFFTDSPAIYGVGSSVFVYHRRLPFLDRLLHTQRLALGRSPHQGFLTVSPQPEVRHDDRC